MKKSSPGDELLKSIRIDRIVSYLEHFGWTRVNHPNHKVLLYEGPKDDEGEPLQIVVPRNHNFEDAEVLVAEAIDLLSIVQQESYAAIIREINEKDMKGPLHRGEPVSMQSSRAKWTVMVCFMGNGKATTDYLSALNEMKSANLGADINVLAQVDSGKYNPPQRYRIERKGSLSDDLIVDKAVTNYPGTDSPVNFSNFLSYCVDMYPAERYMAVLSGNAVELVNGRVIKDENSKPALTISELRDEFERIKDRGNTFIDVLGFDNSPTSTVEMCYELRGLAGIVVGGENLKSTVGWPYRRILTKLNDQLQRSGPENGGAETAAKAIVEEYINHYSDYWIGGFSVTQSALNLNRVRDLKDMVNSLGQAMEEGLRDRRFQDSLLLAHWEAQSYNGEQFVDLFDFCQCLEKRMDRNDQKSVAVVHQCQGVKHFLESEFVLKSSYCGPAYQYSYGVSIYFPWSQLNEEYKNLSFVRDSGDQGWCSFLETYLERTRRAPRSEQSGSERITSERVPIDTLANKISIRKRKT